MLTTEQKPDDRLVIEVEDLSRIKLLSIHNRILVKPLYDARKAKSKAGLFLSGDIEFEKAENSNRVGEVISLPASLCFNPKSPNTMEWKTTLEVQVGDLVWYDITEAWNSPIIKCNGEIYYLVRYASCIVAKRGEEVICLNGFCLLEPIYEAPKTSLVAPDTAKKLNEWEAVVRFAGKPNETYRNKEYQDAEVHPGDRVRFRRLRYGECAAVIFLENEKFPFFDGKMYRIAQLRDFDCVIS